jgi:hypothetical protein
MAARWRSEDTDDLRPDTGTSEYSTGYSTPVDSPSPTASRPIGPRASDDELNTPPPTAMELPPLVEECAKYVLSVIVLYIRQTAPSTGSEPDTSLSYYGLEAEDQPRATHSFFDSPTEPPQPFATLLARPTIRTQASAASFASMSYRSYQGSGGTPIPIPRDALTYSNTPQMMAESNSSLIALIHKYAGLIVYHLSASNWDVVFSRVRKKIHALTKSEAGTSSDVIDLQLMTQCALDKSRLIQLLQG